MGYIIGIDAGGTKTTALVISEKKEILYQTESGIGNPAANYDLASQHLKDVVQECLKNEFGHQITGIAAGIAGIEAGDNRNKIQQDLLEVSNLPIILMNDAELAHYAILEGNDGVITIAGTGSISFGKRDGQTSYSGGWGHLLGDEGSSYHIAVSACRKITQAADAGRAFSEFEIAVMNELQLSEPNDLKGFIYQSGKDRIAELTKSINEMALSGNEEAVELFKIAGKQLAMQTAALIRKMNFPSHIMTPIGGFGSLLLKNEMVQESFMEDLKREIGSYTWMEAESSPALGAYYAWRDKGGIS
ncbi:BadF/BadG/BcrA/BcrD ATPase family protein [Falsibacillus pallidus]|uniref:N-acetylglucosamine kinase-like BadF-type ATPase n=1 Tax=Falsibacillus pallidus TaxID=493781 RepID=A0A370GC91_9BACI|nr:BadF/BadG/BcrA/BcrD ATPase family protein [Falsibacillus pallidus]RDI41398.1 N-acetylglucosamine kinase-like BadF-type ATPase [Falsibacillus pallidus]